VPGPRIQLIHWNAKEAARRLAELRALGYDGQWQEVPGGPALRVLSAAPPAAFVIDLSQAPTKGVAVAVFLRQRKATRTVPLIFAGGAEEGVRRAREVLPDALYARWERMETVLEEALANPRTDVVVPKTMDLWAGRALPEKLGVSEDTALAVLGGPAGFERRLGAARGGGEGRVPLILVFARTKKELEVRFATALQAMGRRGRVWLIWPKKSAGGGAELTLETVRAAGRGAGLAEAKICAVDEDWSGLLYTQPRKAK